MQFIYLHAMTFAPQRRFAAVPKKISFLHYMKKLIFFVTSQSKTNHVFVFVVYYIQTILRKEIHVIIIASVIIRQTSDSVICPNHINPDNILIYTLDWDFAALDVVGLNPTKIQFI